MTYNYFIQAFYPKEFKSKLVTWLTTPVLAWGLSFEVGILTAEQRSATLLLAFDEILNFIAKVFKTILVEASSR